MGIPSAPPAIIFVNADLTPNVQAVLTRQLFIDGYMDGYEFDARISSDPNYPSVIYGNNLRILVIRSFRDKTNRNLADLAIFVKAGLATVEKNNFGPPGLTLPVDQLYFSELIVGVKLPARVSFTTSGLVSIIGGNAFIPQHFPQHFPKISGVFAGGSLALGDTGGGVPIKITGSFFFARVTVTIGGQACTSIVIVDSNTIYAETPALAAGTYDVIVTTSVGPSLPLVAGFESWYPTQIAGMRVYDGELGVTGNPVSAWADQNGGTQNLSQGTPANRPDYQAKSFGEQNRHALVFDAVADALALTAPIACQLRTTFVAIKWVSGLVPHYPIIGVQTAEIVTGTTNGTDDFALDATGGATTMRHYDANGGVNRRSPDDFSLEDGSAQVIGEYFDGAGGHVSFYRWNTQQGSTLATTVYTPDWSSLGAGVGNSGGYELGCACILEGTLSASDQEKLVSWMYGKFVARGYAPHLEAGTVNPGLFARDGAGLLAPVTAPFVYIIGGWNSQPPAPFDPINPKVTNEIWRAPLSDFTTWTLIHANDQSPPLGPSSTSCFPPQHTAGWLVHVDQGIEYLYSIGSDIFNSPTGPNPTSALPAGNGDVWRARVNHDGSLGNWARVCTGAPWGPIVLHMVASFQGALYVMGGQTDFNDNSTANSHVFRSADGGSTWTQLTDAPWAPRGMVYDPCVFNGKLWVMGGGGYNPPRASGCYNDVWNFDGTTWTMIADNDLVPWQRRCYHTTKAWDGKLWVINGASDPYTDHSDGNGNIGDIWSSPDGTAGSWIQTTIVPWRNSHADGMAVLSDRILSKGGNGEIGEGVVNPTYGDLKVYSLSRRDFAHP